MQNIGTIVGFDSFQEIVDFIKQGNGFVRFDDYSETVQEYDGNLMLGVNTFDSLFYEHDFSGMTEEPFDQDCPPDVIHVVFTKDNADISNFIGYQFK